MIKLSKGPEPKILFENFKAWTKILVDHDLAQTKPKPSEVSHYRHKKIKQQLINETHGKCAYCESKLLHIHHGDVEHIEPKSIYVNKTFQWSNLTLSCEICNQNKTNHDPNLMLIINPYTENPKDHIKFGGPIVLSLSDAGSSTEILLDLNRIELIERRKDKVISSMTLLNRVLSNSTAMAIRKVILKDFIKNELSNDKEYSAMVNDLFETLKDRIPPEILT